MVGHLDVDSDAPQEERVAVMHLSRSELEVRQAQRRRLRWHPGAAHVLGRRVLQQPVDDASAVEAGDDRHPAGHGRRFEPADILAAHMASGKLTRAHAGERASARRPRAVVVS